AWSCRQPRAAGRQSDWDEFFRDGVGGEAIGASARAGARGYSYWCARQSCQCCGYRSDSKRRGSCQERTMGLQIQILNANTSGEIDAAFAELARERAEALLVGGGAFFTARRVQLAQRAARHAMPTIYPARLNAEVGGLMSYGASVTDVWRQV